MLVRRLPISVGGGHSCSPPLILLLILLLLILLLLILLLLLPLILSVKEAWKLKSPAADRSVRSTRDSPAGEPSRRFSAVAGVNLARDVLRVIR